jgi:hypothetical protein
MAELPKKAQTIWILLLQHDWRSFLLLVVIAIYQSEKIGERRENVNTIQQSGDYLWKISRPEIGV